MNGKKVRISMIVIGDFIVYKDSEETYDVLKCRVFESDHELAKFKVEYAHTDTDRHTLG